MKYLKIMQAMQEHPWGILPEKLADIRHVVLQRVDGGAVPEDHVREITGGRRPDDRPWIADIQAQNGVGGGFSGNVGVLPIIGTIIPRVGAMMESSGLTSPARIAARFREMLADDSVAKIVLEVDSPGGQVGGVPELSDLIFNNRGRKPIVASVNTLAASAAYWIASAADEVEITPSGEAGSIGVFAVHQEFSKMEEALGIGTTLISAGRFKTEANPFEPLTEEARAFIQSRVDEYFDLFTRSVARNRGVSAARVRDGFGEGRLLGARESVRAGLADRVGTLDQTLARAPRRRSAAAESATSQPSQKTLDGMRRKVLLLTHGP